MKRKISILVCILIVALFVVTEKAVRADEPIPTSDVYEIPVELLELERALEAGTNATDAWNNLSIAEQDKILMVLFPDLTEADLTEADKRPQLKGVAIASAEGEINEEASVPAPMWCTGYYAVDNGARPAGQSDGPFVDGYGGANGATLGLSQTGSISNQFSANVGVDAVVVSAGVGFNVTQSYGVTYSYSVEIPPYKTYRLMAYHRYNGVGFDVWDDDCGDPPDTYVGNGTAWEYSHIYYTHWEM